jgi:hypothetical protein
VWHNDYNKGQLVLDQIRKNEEKKRRQQERRKEKRLEKKKMKEKNQNNQNLNQFSKSPEPDLDSYSDEDDIDDNNNTSLIPKEKKIKRNKIIKVTFCEFLPEKDGDIKINVKYIRDKAVVDNYLRYKKWTESFKSNRGISYYYDYYLLLYFLKST